MIFCGKNGIGWPLKPKRIYSTSGVPSHYSVMMKKNGDRVHLDLDNPLQLFNRHGKPLSRGKDSKLPKNWEFVKSVFSLPTFTDGELVGTFHTNDKVNCYVMWDAPLIMGENFSRLTLKERYDKLLGYANTSKRFEYPNDLKRFGTYLIEEYKGYGVYLAIDYPQEEWENLWKVVLKEDDYWMKTDIMPVNEGIVFKNPNAKNLWIEPKTIEHISQLKLKVRDTWNK